MVFSEPVDETSANKESNYTIEEIDTGGVIVKSATRQADSRTVVLTTTSPLTLNSSYKLTLDNVEDIAGNPIDPAISQTFEYDARQTLNFQQNPGGYTGTVDTNLFEYYPGTDYSTAVSLNVDAVE
jgi:hypothetical protein